MTPEEFETAFWAIAENGKPFPERLKELQALFKGNREPSKPLIRSKRYNDWALAHADELLK